MNLRSAMGMGLLSGALLSLAGCAQQPWEAPESQVTALAPDRCEVSAGDFQVVLTLRDRKHFDEAGNGDAPPAPSSYHVTYHSPAMDKSLRLESQFILETVKYNPRVLNRALRLTVSAEGDALVIDEDIPNDCAPQVNYSYVGVDSQGNLQSFYFELPTDSTGEMQEFPHLTELRHGVVHYRFASGASGSIAVANLERVAHPQQPG